MNSELMLAKKELVIAGIEYDLSMDTARGLDDPNLLNRYLEDNREENRRKFIESGRRNGHIMSTYGILNAALMLMEKEPIYRIRVNEDTSVDTDCYDLLENFAPELKQRYDSVTSLPEWVQERLSVLMVLDPDKVTGEVTGIGRRINKRVFWVYKNGYDPRSEGQEGSPQTT